MQDKTIATANVRDLRVILISMQFQGPSKRPRDDLTDWVMSHMPWQTTTSAAEDETGLLRLATSSSQPVIHDDERHSQSSVIDDDDDESCPGNSSPSTNAARNTDRLVGG